MTEPTLEEANAIVEAGRKAGLGGKPANACPYSTLDPATRPRALLWVRGYVDGRE